VQRRTEAVMKHPVSNRRSDQTTGSQTAVTKWRQLNGGDQMSRTDIYRCCIVVRARVSIRVKIRVSKVKDKVKDMVRVRVRNRARR